MSKFLLQFLFPRVLQLLPVLLGISLLSFGLLYMAGSDAITELYSDRGHVAQEIIAAKRAELGLDRPFLEQYLLWLSNILQGNMGTSYVQGQDVLQLFLSKLPATLWLCLGSMALTIIISVPLGVVAAVKNHQLIDFVLRGCSFVGNALPNFLVALLLIQALAIKWPLLPSFATGLSLQDSILPILTLTIAMSAKYLRQVRALVLEELQQDYVLGARARGIRSSVILGKSVLRCALLPLVTMVALSLGSLLGGTAIVESIFMWDGVGKLAVDAIMLRDYPVVQAYVLWMAGIYVLVNLVADVLYQLLDPRLRNGREVGR